MKFQHVSSYADFLQAVSQFQCCRSRGSGSTDVLREEAVLNACLSAWRQHKMAVLRKWLQGKRNLWTETLIRLIQPIGPGDHKSVILTVMSATVRLVRNVQSMQTLLGFTGRSLFSILPLLFALCSRE